MSSSFLERIKSLFRRSKNATPDLEMDFPDDLLTRFNQHRYFLHLDEQCNQLMDTDNNELAHVWGTSLMFKCEFCKKKRLYCGSYQECNDSNYRQCLTCGSTNCVLIPYEPIYWKLKSVMSSDKTLTLILNTVGLPENLLKFLVPPGGNLPIFSNAIGRFPNLSTLILRGNQIEELPDCFSDLKHVTFLDLSDNKLKSIPQTLFFLRLERLILKNNKIEIIPVDVLEMIYLVELNVDGNPLTSPGPSICSKGVVEILKFLRQTNETKQKTNTGDYITADNKTVSETVECQRRIIAQNEYFCTGKESGGAYGAYMTVVTEGTTERTEMHPRVVAHEDYDRYLRTRLNPEIIQELCIRGIRCYAIPKSIGRCLNLRMADFQDNQIASIPQEIVHLQKLEILDVSNNFICRVSPCVGFLSSLRRLNLASNNITHLPMSFLNLPRLEELDVSGTNMTSPSMEICSSGLSAIFTELKLLRSCRRNKDAFLKAWYDDAEGANCNLEVNSLKSLCLQTLLTYKMSLPTQMTSMPPLYKRLITQEVAQRDVFKMISCHICQKNFSSEVYFKMHECHTDYDVEYVLTHCRKYINIT
ncbi:leucine-rich repeat-containing protein 40 [Patella vulgata]|uniref:leucine-rich repeat-containing protein 40 n=1 Tax=Patella vulgata TaxID=6465 RepID=UPI0021809936|nr:leucine-rich repeat-containing protein 40 [Patella vulgata]